MCLSAAGQVVALDEGRHEATVDVDGATRVVSLAVLALEGQAVAPGDWVVVHTGFAVGRLDDTDVVTLLALRDEMRERQDS